MSTRGKATYNLDVFYAIFYIRQLQLFLYNENLVAPE